MEIIHSIFQSPESLAIFCLFGLPVIGVTIFWVVWAVLRHRERMAMIANGMHPDQEPSEHEE